MRWSDLTDRFGVTSGRCLPGIAAAYTLLALSTWGLRGQQVVEGTVTDTLGMPVIRAGIHIRRSGSAAVLAFAYTDPSGTYRMELPASDSLFLVAGALGYGEQVHRIPDGFQASGAYRHDFRLSARPLKLEEIVLEETAIRENGDTVRIRVSEFMAGNEVVAEDILRRIPGVEVGRDGRITVQGKPVSRVLIEGDDLMDRQYPLLTRNLPAETVGKVEILKDYDPNPLLKPLRRTGEVALNIGLKEGVKQTGFEKGEAGGGPGGVYALGLQVVRIRNMAKHYSFGSLAEPGRASAGAWADMQEAEMDSEIAPIGTGEMVPFFVSEGVLPATSGQKRQLINTDGSISTNLVLKPGRSLHIRANLRMNRLKGVREQRLLEVFQADTLAFRNLETTRAVRRQRVAAASLKGTLTPSPDLRLEWHAHARGGTNQADSQMDLNGTARSRDAFEKAGFLDNRFSGSWKIDSAAVLSLDLSHIMDRKPANLRTDLVPVGMEWAAYPLADGTEQTLVNRLGFSGGELAYRKKAGRFSWQARFGFFRRYTALTSQLTFHNDSMQYVVGPAYRNAATNRLTALYSEPRIDWDRGAFGFSLSLRASVNRNRFADSEDDVLRNLGALEPRIMLRWNPERLNKVVLNYRYVLRQTGLDEQYTGYMLRGYRDLTRGAGEYFHLRGHRFTAGYTYGNWGEKFLMHLLLHGQWDPEYLGSDRIRYPLFSLSGKSLFQGRRMLAGNLALDRFLESLSLNLKLRLAASAQAYRDQLNSQDRYIRSTVFRLAPEIRSVLMGPFQFHLGAAWNWNWNSLSTRGAVLNAEAFLDLEWDAGKAGFLTLHTDAYHTRKAGSPTVLSDLNWQFRNGKKGIGLTLSATNLWNTRSLRRRYLTGTGFLELQERLRPRALMVQVSCRF